MNNKPMSIHRGLPITDIPEVLPLTVLPNSLINAFGIATTSAWMGVRDALATYGASWVGFAATLGARQLTRAVPGTGHVFSALDALAVGITTYAFGSGLGTQGWHPNRRWGGAAASAACMALLLYTLYSRQDETTRDKLATSWFGTAIYSVARDFLQGQGRRIFPELSLDPRLSLHFEGGRNTCKHIARLVIAVATYTATSIALSPGAALRNILSSDFSGMNQDLGLFSSESSQVFGLRAANEWSDAFIGTVVLALFFRQDIRQGRLWCSNQSATPKEMATSGNSRVSMNLLVNTLQARVARQRRQLLRRARAVPAHAGAAVPGPGAGAPSHPARGHHRHPPRPRGERAL